MSAQVAITQLPAAGAITGTEAVPIVQNGVTVQTTTGAISASPSQTYTYLTVTQTPQLANSRYVGVSNGLSITDGGAQGLFNISPTGALLSLVNSGTGFQVKTSSTAITNRSIAVTGAGLSITNGDGISGNPTIGLAGQVLSLANLSANGLMTITTGGVLNATSVTGTANQIGVANGNGIAGAPTVSIVDNATLPGTGGVVVPKGTTAQQPVGVSGQFRFNTTTNRFEGYISGSWVNIGSGDGTVTNVNGTTNQIAVLNGTTTPVISIYPNPIIPGTASITMPIGTTAARPTGVNGMFRYNTDIALFEGFINGSWQVIAAGTGVTSVATGTGLTGGPITSTGTISIANSGVTAGTYGSTSQVPSYTVNAQGQLTAASNITISPTDIGAVTSVSGTSGEITSSGGQTPVISLPNSLTFTSKTITGGAFNMASAQVVSDTVTTNTAAQTLTNKTISGASNTLTNIANGSLTNSSLTVGTTNIALGATSLTLGGLTSVAVTQDPTTALQLATKQYVDSVAAVGLTFHQPVQAATTASLASITGGTVTYNNGTAGVGATITLSVALTVLDGYTLLNTNRILVKDETNQAYNGIYTWATGGTVLTRATDADTYGSGSNQLSLNDYFYVQNGTVNKGIAYVLSAPAGTITFGTSNIQFAEFSSSQVYTGTSPINVSGTVISLTTVPATLGGTGQSSYAVGNLLYATSTTALSKLPIGTNSQVLKSNGTAPYWDLNPTYLPVVLHSGASTNIPIGSGYLPVLLHDGVTIANVALF
jgi:hypothetical protein